MNNLKSPLSSDMKQLNETITRMILDKSIFKAMDEPWFQEQIYQLFNIAFDNSHAKQKLMAISALSRIAFFVKAHRISLFKRLQPAFKQPLPSLQNLNEADHRLNVAKSLECCESNEWLCEYLISESFLEERAEKTRESLINNLVQRTSDFKAVLELSITAVGNLRKNKSITPDQLLKRYVLVFKLLRKAIATGSHTAHDDSGLALQKLFVTAAKGTSATKDFKVKAAFADEIIYLVHSLIQIRFSLATEANTYLVLQSIKTWFSKSEWLLFLSRSDSVKTVQSDLSEAVLILAKQGLSDAELLGFLVLTFATKDKAKPLLTSIADNSLTTPANIKTWLKSVGRITESSEKAARDDSSLLNADQSIALLLLEATRLESILSTAEENISSAIEMFEPQLGDQTQTLFVRNRSILNSVKSLANKRSLQLSGNPGDITDYSPLEHNLISGKTMGVRKVRIVTPKVERVIRDRVSTVLAAQVEAIE
ncbi:hypothetical protein BHECKSOX_439 [Bathymodiolus heckerae thiotrophic gill symbiont]|uniref:hypothetical protein n=1 Tax=Bathymodiolus heckerae thiotrophic gill symbiont TaxID=1052212 RepID=UPI0010BA8266|nr:hypothetical protein [Bathymodiolus heckerae thiotrophic gill symbiont]SHN92252.1 hypothetical protein BHECKSOX_439 [Bathymodiolus heckerae thiotrophic gill symbiont]